MLLVVMHSRHLLETLDMTVMMLCVLAVLLQAVVVA
jgi:hypothetical protein